MFEAFFQKLTARMEISVGWRPRTVQRLAVTEKAVTHCTSVHRSGSNVSLSLSSGPGADGERWSDFIREGMGSEEEEEEERSGCCTRGGRRPSCNNKWGCFPPMPPRRRRWRCYGLVLRGVALLMGCCLAVAVMTIGSRRGQQKTRGRGGDDDNRWVGERDID